MKTIEIDEKSDLEHNTYYIDIESKNVNDLASELRSYTNKMFKDLKKIGMGYYPRITKDRKSFEFKPVYRKIKI